MQNFVSFESDVSMYGTSYDFDSVMHYPPKAFSKDGKPTIISKKPDGGLVMVKVNNFEIILEFLNYYHFRDKEII
jgi:hypothetical protein